MASAALGRRLFGRTLSAVRSPVAVTPSLRDRLNLPGRAVCPIMGRMETQETVRAEAARRGVTRMRVQRDREQAAIDPVTAQRVIYFSAVRGLPDAAVAAHPGLPVHVVERVLGEGLMW